ncbi:MAG: VCBS repeat-containing protein [Planctomycetota bacterium]
MTRRPRRVPVPTLVAITVSAVAWSPPAVGQGTLEVRSRAHLPQAEGDGCSVAQGDLDGDGDLDFVVGGGSVVYGDGSSAESPNRLYLNDGRGVFVDVTAVGLPAGGAPATAIAAVDVDRDGDLDLTLAVLSGQNLLYLNNGVGVFTDATLTHLPPVTDATLSIAAGDLDGDGDSDLVVGDAYTAPDRVLLNDGAGVFAAGGAIGSGGWNPTLGLALGDVDGDGNLDVLAAYGVSDIYAGAAYGRPNRLFLNDGAGRFTEHSFPTASEPSTGVALGDVDGDGDLDAAIANGVINNGFFVYSVAYPPPASPNRLYINDGAGNFTQAPPGQLPVDADHSRAVAFADIDANGDLDLVFGNASWGDTDAGDSLYLNDGSGWLVDASSRLPDGEGPTCALTVGDMTGNGLPDVLSIHLGRQDRLAANDGAGGFVDVSSAGLPSDVDSTDALAVGDVNGDGAPDLIAGNRSSLSGLAASTEGRTNRVYLNSGFGQFAEAATALPASLGDTRALALGDVDGDLDLDLVVGNRGQVLSYPFPPAPTAAPLELYLSDGTGGFRVASGQLPATPLMAEDLFLADVDADGDRDLIIATRRENALYLNDGLGHFTDASQTHLPQRRRLTRSIASGDVDQDGDPDLLLANEAAQNRLLRNDGTGRFVDVTETAMPSRADRTRAVAFADVDRDGDVDIITANDRQANRLLLNDGTGRFVDVTGSRLPRDTDSTFAVALADLDEDGAPDIIFGNATEANRVYVNDGTGFFAPAPAMLAIDQDRTEALAVADVDGDGDLDLITGNTFQSSIPTVRWSSPNRLLLNHRRQLHAPFAASIGDGYRLDAYARDGAGPGHLALPLLAASAVRPGIPLPPFGTLRLDPATWMTLPPLAVPAPAGVGSIEIMLPNQPSLVGRSFFAQALVLPPSGPARFTNAFEERILP